MILIEHETEALPLPVVERPEIARRRRFTNLLLGLCFGPGREP